jgi:hypothetical protein
MRKKIIFGALIILTLISFACEFNLPKTIEIKGSTSVKFAEKVNIGDMFTDVLKSEIQNENDKMDNMIMTILPCETTENFTFIIHMDLFDQPIDIDNGDGVFPDYPGNELSDLINDLDINGPTTLTNDRIIIYLDEPITLPLSSIGSLLEGFTFKDTKTKLYFSGSDSIFSKLRIDIEIGDSDPITIDCSNGDVENQDSGFDTWKTGYTAAGLPNGGIEIDIPRNGDDVIVDFEVVIPKNTPLQLSDFKDGFIKVEIVVWFPFVLEANAGGAEISFPDDALFSSTDDLFGRSSPGEENMLTDNIENMSLEIVFDKNPFKGSELVVWSGGNIEIRNQLTNNSLSFTISENDMNKINDPSNWPFTPNFKMEFPGGATLSFPRQFNAVEFIFKAKIKYRMDL